MLGELRRTAVWALGLVACGSAPPPRAPAPAEAAPAEAAPAAESAGTPATPESKSDEEAEPGLFDERKSGWAQVASTERKSIAALAEDYLGFIDKARSHRRAARWILERAQKAGAVDLRELGPKSPAQTLATWSDRNSRTLALVKVGTRPVDEGLRIVVASLDAGLIRLTASPVYDSHGLVMLDTTILGSRSLERWLHTPLALDLYSPAQKRRPAVDTVIGDESDEPVFSIPDLLPHLSRKVQRKTLIDSPERLDIVAGRSGRAVRGALAELGLSSQRLPTTEIVAVPAAPPAFVGIDKALVAGPNQESRAMAYASVQALLESTAGHTTLLILQGNDQHDPAGPNAMQRLEQVLPELIGQLAPKSDALALRRAMAKSAVLIADDSKGKRNGGVAINNRHDDAFPRAFRGLLTMLDESEVHYQLVESSGWSQARRVASLDMDAMELSIPIEGVGAPFELMSTYDLYQAHRALKGWVQQ